MNGIKMKEKIKKFYIETLKNIEKLSYAKRNKVGCLIIKGNNIVAFGYNGTPPGFDNCCEIDETTSKPEVIHAEVNAIAKCAREGISTNGASMFISVSPCFDCSKLILQSGIKEVYYLREYRIKESLELLRRSNIKVEQLWWLKKY